MRRTYGELWTLIVILVIAFCLYTTGLDQVVWSAIMTFIGLHA